MKLFAFTMSGASALAASVLISAAYAPMAPAAEAVVSATGGAMAASMDAVAAPANWNDQTGQTALVVRGDGSRLSIPNHSLSVDSQIKFHRLKVNPSERLQVQVFGPEIPVGATAVVVALDGGQLEEAQGKQFFEFAVAADKRIPFTFTAGQTAGLHRVVVRFGNQERLFRFWVGPELPVIVRIPSATVQP